VTSVVENGLSFPLAKSPNFSRSSADMRDSDNHRFAKNIGVAADVFDRPVVTLELPRGQEERPEALSAFMLAANLLRRLFTKVYLVAPDARLGPNPWQLTRLAEL